MRGFFIYLFLMAGVSQPATPEYAEILRHLARGWNTWDVHSVTTQVLLPQGLAVHLGLLEKTRLNGESFLPGALIGRLDKNAEHVFPGPHTFDGSYTDLTLSWKGQSFRVQSAADGGDLVFLITPVISGQEKGRLPMDAVFSIGFLWNRPGTVSAKPGGMEAQAGGSRIPFFLDGSQTTALSAPVSSPYLAATLVKPVALSSGKRRSVAEVRDILAGHSRPASSVTGAIETVLGWDTIYDPEFQRVISPVSRLWSVSWGGYVLFDWDSFFAASLASAGDRELAYANAIETLKEATPAGFVPNYARAGGWKSGDRSEPPVGAITVLALYRKFHDRWLLRDTFAGLLAWNRWWAQHRDEQGYLVWGSDAHGAPEDRDDPSRGTLQGARFESGLDNSPMYDTAPFDQKSGHMMLADAGLMGLYVADCDALAEIAAQLEKRVEARELTGRADLYRAKLRSLWDEKSGLFLNKNLITGEFSRRISPTNFYPLLARAATEQQAHRMVEEHLQNPTEFGGEFVLPSIARSDAAFKDQDYWRGRIWGPMNYLVYLGLRNYPALAAARQDLATKSLSLFEADWQANGHVHENYNAIVGQGDDVSSSDRFYHWGALLGFIQYLEQSEPAKPKE